VVAALLNWGRAQVAGDGDVDESSDDVKLRRKIAASLNVIRFARFDSKQFAELCRGDLGPILNGEEKFKILECISLGDWKTMPVNLGPLSNTPRIRQTFSIEVSSYTEKTCSKVQSQPFIDYATFQVGKDIEFLGIDVTLPDLHLWTYPSIDVRDRDYPELPLVTLGNNKYSMNMNKDGTLHIKADKTFILKCALVYRIYFTYSPVKLHAPFYNHRIIGYSKYENENIVKVLGSFGYAFDIKKWHFKNII
jgi:hypothetical protein